MNNEPVAYVNSMCNDYIDWKADPMSIDGQPLYTNPKKYCPSENNQAYEKGFIDGMAKQRDSKVQQFVEGYTPPVKELTDEEIQEVAQALIDDCSYCSLHFARAILRKAQEK